MLRWLLRGGGADAAHGRVTVYIWVAAAVCVFV